MENMKVMEMHNMMDVLQVSMLLLGTFSTLNSPLLGS